MVIKLIITYLITFGKYLLLMGRTFSRPERMRMFFKQYIKELDDIITFEGWVSGTNKIRLLNLCQIFVLPSYKEGLPISILESMAYGMPIIATPVGAIPSVVKNGDNGFLVPTGNLESLSVAINTLIDNHLLISKMGLKSLKKVQRFMPENVSARLTDIYLRLI